MARHFNGLIQFADVMGKKSTMRFSDLDDMTALELLANQMSARSCAKAVAFTVSEQEDSPAGVGVPITGKWDSVGDKCEIIVEDTATGRSAAYELPAPLDTLMTHKEGVGYTMTKAQGDAFASDLSTATGKTYRFVKGRHIARMTQAQV